MMEETEYAFLRSRGLSVVMPDRRGTLGFPRLQVSFQIHQPLRFEQTVEIHLRLVDLDGKQIVYEFEIVDDSLGTAPLVTGRFAVVCCRFPDNRNPYAVLIPERVTAALTPSADRLDG